MTTEDPAARPTFTKLPADVVPLVPMRNLVLFPLLLAPITVGRPRSVAAIAQSLASSSPSIGNPQK